MSYVILANDADLLRYDVEILDALMDCSVNYRAMYTAMHDGRRDCFLWFDANDNLSAVAAGLRINSDVYRVTALAGTVVESGLDLDSAMTFVEDHARSLGCTQCQIQGRKGWGRIFPDYTHEFTTIGKRL